MSVAKPAPRLLTDYWYITVDRPEDAIALLSRGPSGPREVTALAHAVKSDDYAAVEASVLRGSGGWVACYRGQRVPDTPPGALLFRPAELVWVKSPEEVLHSLSSKPRREPGSGRGRVLAAVVIIAIGIGLVLYRPALPDAVAPVLATAAGAFRAPLPAPGRPALVRLTDSTAEVQWPEVAGAEGYRVRWTAEGSVRAEEQRVLEPRGTLTGLRPDTRYEVQVIAWSAAGESRPSGSLSLRTYLPWDDVFANTRRGVVMITGYETILGRIWSDRESGSGFFVTPEVIVTSFSAIEEIDWYLTVWVRGTDGTVHRERAKVFSTDPDSDLALLRLDDDAKYRGKALPLSTEPLWPGQPVAIAGHPSEETLRYATGEFERMADKVEFVSGAVGTDVQVVAVASLPGSTGSPLLDGYGRVVGVVNSGSTGDQRVTYAVRAKALDAFMKREGIRR